MIDNGARSKHRQSPRLCLISGISDLSRALLAVLIWGAVISGITVDSAFGQTVEVYTVSGVKVDETAKAAADARRKALSVGEKIAVETLLRRITMRIDHPRLPVLESRDISPLVSDIAVAEEKNSQVRYLADLSIRFRATEVRNLLRDFGIEFAETISKPVLVLPVFESFGALSLWDDPNPWLKSWTRQTLDAGLVPMRLPKGDLKDIATIGAPAAVKGDTARLSAIARRYGVGTVSVVHAALAASRRGLPQLNLKTTNFGENRRDYVLEVVVRAEPGEAVDSMLARAADEMIGVIEDQWKQENLIQFENHAVLAAAMPIRGLSDWVKAQRRLQKVAIIEQVDLVLLSRNEARINLFYLGDEEQLKLALTQADFSLTQEEGSWTLAAKRSR